MTLPRISSEFILFAKSNKATGPSYSSPWFAPVKRIVGPSPFFATEIGITIEPHAELS